MEMLFNYKVLLIKQLSIPTYSTKVKIFLPLKMLLQNFWKYFMRTISLDQMKMEWISHNLVGKQIFLTDEIFDNNFQEP